VPWPRKHTELRMFVAVERDEIDAARAALAATEA
jgi:hypothetical protein